MTKEEIITAVDNGIKVHWRLDTYTIIKSRGDYWIKHQSGNLMGLFDMDGNANIDLMDCYMEGE